MSSLCLCTYVSARLLKWERPHPNQSLLLQRKVSTHLVSALPQQFAGQRRTRNIWGTSTCLEGLVSAVVFFVALFVHGLSSPSQHLVLVRASVLITQHVTWSLLCLPCSSVSSLSDLPGSLPEVPDGAGWTQVPRLWVGDALSSLPHWAGRCSFIQWVLR